MSFVWFTTYGSFDSLLNIELIVLQFPWSINKLCLTLILGVGWNFLSIPKDQVWFGFDYNGPS